MKSVALALSLAVLPIAAVAQDAYLVKDINTSSSGVLNSSRPTQFLRFGSRIVFIATPAYGSPQLWSTDGTASGTTKITSANAYSGTGVSRVTVLNGELVFNASDDAHGEELWLSDGTAAGTRLLADIKPGTPTSLPGDRIVYHGQMLFAADDGVDGYELWATDGTPAGTHFFKDLVPGPGSSNPRSFVVLNDVLYFAAAGALWKSDGTPAGTVQVSASNLGAYGKIVVAGNRLFFTGSANATGVEPWISDGTAAGTHMIADIAPGPPSSVSYDLTPFGDRVLFVANDQQHGSELWISDGTAAGTHIVRDLVPGSGSGVLSPAIGVLSAAAYFTGVSADRHAGLWKTDGTDAGTTLLHDFGVNGGAADFLTVGNEIFFAGTENNVPALWVTDGTPAGTHAVKSSDPKPVVDISLGLWNIDGIVYFSAATPLYGSEPWKSDGTDAGTAMIANLDEDPAPSSTPRNFTVAGNLLFFDAWDGSAPPYSGDGVHSLWRTDGTAAGTIKLADAPATPYIAVGPSIFFTNQGDLWTSDGTPEGTKPATDFLKKFPQQSASIAFTTGNLIFANVSSALWVTTSDPNAPAVSLGVSGSMSSFIALAGRVYFLVDSITSYALWTTDGTPAGTFPVLPSISDPARNLTAVDGRLYFATGSYSGPNALWASDGTIDGTKSIGTFPSTPANLIAAGHKLFFTINSTLWVSDGTQAGTQSLAVAPSSALFATGDRVVFVVNDAVTGIEPWVSDGTAAGTHVLKDIVPGTLGSLPSYFKTIDNLVYFAAYDPTYGNELWVTDGTAEGTKVINDTEPGSTGSYPKEFARAGNHLFFEATTKATGDELWAIALDTQQLSISDARVVEGDTGTTTMHFTVTLSAAATRIATVDYATSDGTATAGSDYDAASGTLTFAPGETSKGIDVVVHGDTVAEGNETLFVTLRNAAGATVTRASGVGIIEDDDQSADLALSADFSKLNALSVGITVKNGGPQTATRIQVKPTAAPGPITTGPCYSCAPSLAPGGSARVWDVLAGTMQYVTATVSALQRDPQTSNNSIGFILGSGPLAMDALYLQTGGRANVWFSLVLNETSASVTSSDPSVLSVPATVAVTPGTTASFAVTALAPGHVTITITTATRSVGTLAVDVVAPGSKPRFPSGLGAYASPFAQFDRPATVRVSTSGTAPFTGASPTGPVTITANGSPAATLDLTAGTQQWSVPVYLADVGVNHIVASYAGDANFLPASVSMDVTGQVGYTSILADVERNGTNAVVHVQVTGSPRATPTGNVMVQVQGVVQTVTVPLQTRVDGIAVADVPLSNFGAGTQTLFIAYSGDAHYAASSQTIRITDVHKRSTRH